MTVWDIQVYWRRLASRRLAYTFKPAPLKNLTAGVASLPPTINFTSQTSRVKTRLDLSKILVRAAGAASRDSVHESFLISLSAGIWRGQITVPAIGGSQISLWIARRVRRVVKEREGRAARILLINDNGKLAGRSGMAFAVAWMWSSQWPRGFVSLNGKTSDFINRTRSLKKNWAIDHSYMSVDVSF